MIRIKRIYDPPSQSDGMRILVDRLWPRGIRKDEAKIDEWLKDIAPSDTLRKWFAHDPAKWPVFREKYRKELKDRKDIVDRLRKEANKGRVTLLFSTKDTEHNNAVALKEMIEQHE
jgi:uncharacterized protein YeaO (DUF488 family)